MPKTVKSAKQCYFFLQKYTLNLFLLLSKKAYSFTFK